MLKLIWTATPTGAPDNRDDAAAVDHLTVLGTGRSLQEYTKTEQDFAPASVALAAHIDAWVAGRSDPAAPNEVAYRVNASAENRIHNFAGMNHWAYYMNDGNRRFVQDLLTESGLTVAGFKAALVPAGMDSPAFGMFAGTAIPATPDRCDARRGEVNVASGGNVIGGS